MYLLINHDQTINLVADHPVNNTIHQEGLTFVELPDHTVDDVMNGIPIEEAVWDAQAKKIIRHPLFAVGSERWRQQQAGIRINQFYPLYQQINILRGNNKAAKKKMVQFIDQCRLWSNDSMSEPTLIHQIVP